MSQSDQAFQDASGWTVVGFKTDAEVHQRLLNYRRQVAWYVRGMEIITQIRPPAGSCIFEFQTTKKTGINLLWFRNLSLTQRQIGPLADFFSSQSSDDGVDPLY
jgi:hypothetical protein